MLRWRLLMSFILVPALVAMFWCDQQAGSSAPLLLTFCGFAALRCAFELTGLMAVRNMRPHFPATAAASVLLVISGWAHTWLSPEPESFELLTSMGLIGTGLTLTFVSLLLLETARYDHPGGSMESLGCNLLTIFYAGGLIAVTAQLRWFPQPATGYFVLASVIICVKCGDTFAYTFGRLWGKRKLAPKLSPGKTWMGLFGAVSGSTLGGWLWLTFGGGLFAARPVASSWWIVLLYSSSLGIIGLFGDLCESLIKRDVEKKDSAALMPGFGGLLDLFDSPLFAGPFALLWWHILPPAGLP